MSVLFIFLPFILILGAITSYEDVKHGKIRNKWVILALIIALTINFILLLAGRISLNYLIRLFSLFFVSFLGGFALWYIKMWSSGDAKLFAAYIALIPLEIYPTFDFFPTYLIVCTFIPAFFISSITLLARTTLKQKLSSLKQAISLKSIASLFITVFAASWLISAILLFFRIPLNFVFTLVGIILLLKLISYAESKFLKKQISMPLFLAISIFRIILEFNQLSSFNFWKAFFILTIGFAMFRMFILDLSGIFTIPVKIADLKKGMIPADLIINARGYRKIQANAYKGEKNILYNITPEGLSEEEIKKLKALFAKGKFNFNALNIHQTAPFAPYLFLGVLITLLLKYTFVF